MIKSYLGIALLFNMGFALAGETARSETEFNWSFNGSFIIDEPSGEDFDALSMGVTYDFLTIDQNIGPFKEAVFIGKQNRAALSLNISQTDLDSSVGTFSDDITAVGFDLDYFANNGFYLGFSYAEVNSDGQIESDPLRQTFNDILESRSLDLGYFFDDDFLVSFFVESFEDSGTDVGFSAKKVWSFDDEQYLNLETRLTFFDGTVSADYYFSRSTSVGFKYQYLEDAVEDGGTFTFEHFFTPLVSIRANALGYGLLEDQVSVEFIARF